MSRFEQRKREAMRDPEFAQAYRDADIEIKFTILCESWPLYWKEINTGLVSIPESSATDYTSWTSTLYHPLPIVSRTAA